MTILVTIIIYNGNKPKEKRVTGLNPISQGVVNDDDAVNPLFNDGW